MKILLLPLVFLLGYFIQSPPRIELKGYWHCQSALDETTGNALASYAWTQRECQNGNVILAFEKRRSRRQEKAIFEIVDTIHVKTTNPGHTLTISRCTTATGKTQLYFVLFRQDASGEKYLRNIQHAWGADARDHLVEVPVKTIKCLNNDYGADL